MAREKDISPDTSGKSSSPVAAATSRAEKIIKSAKRTNGGSQPSGIPAADVSGIQQRLKEEEIIAELERLYSPEAFTPIVNAPANLMSMLTGRKLWELTSNESKGLATAASVTAKYYMPTDPKMVALLMLVGSIATIYGTRVGLHIRAVNDEKKAKKNDAAPAS